MDAGAVIITKIKVVQPLYKVIGAVITAVWECFHKQQVYKDMPGAANVKGVAEKSLRAAKAGVVVCTPDTVSTVHRIIASVLPHWLLAKVCK